MVENKELSLEDLYAQYTSEEHIKESFERRTVPTGGYTFQAEKATARELGDNAPWPGRKVATFGGPLTLDGAKKGRLMFDASWELVRREKDQKADGPSQLWGQLVVAMDAREKAVGEVITMMKDYPIYVYVTESFKTPEGWRTAKDEESRKTYRAAGFEARNFVQNIGKAR